MLCDDCNKRNLCNSLCPEAELYVNQDHIPQREMPIGLPKYSKPSIEQVSNILLTKREKEIVTLLGSGLSRADVCQLLKISRESLRKHIQRINKKRHDSNYK